MGTENLSESVEDTKTNGVKSKHDEIQWSGLGLSERDVEELKKSCLTAMTVKLLGWFTDTNENNRRRLNWPDDWTGDAEGLVFLYPGLDYAKVKLHRPRALKSKVVPITRPAANFSDHTRHQGIPGEADDEPIKKKYEAPFEHPPHIFNTESICADLNEQEVPVAIIEGEKKAALLAQEGVPALGIPGISMAHDVEARRRSRDDLMDEWVPHPEAASYLAQERTVLVCGDGPDMDGANVNVVREVVRIAKGLSARGCDPQIPYVEHDPKYEKSGVDDWVYREMRKLLAANPRKTEAWARRSLIQQYIASARPALPSALCDWLVMQHEDNGELKEIEIKRALVWCSAWFANEQGVFRRWVGNLKKKKVCKPEVVDRLVQALPKVENRFEPRTWVQHWIEKNGVTYSYANEGFQSIHSAEQSRGAAQT